MTAKQPTVRLENGTKRGAKHTVKDSDPVDCPIHDFHTTWGELDPIQQLAVLSGLDIEGDRCILAPNPSAIHDEGAVPQIFGKDR